MNWKFIWGLVAILGLALIWAPSAGAQFQCEQQRDGRNTIICAPPKGSMVKNRLGRYVCGPGQCMAKNSSDEVICSAVPGGLMAFDTRNRGLCVGGCVTASESLCVTPIPDPS